MHCWQQGYLLSDTSGIQPSETLLLISEMASLKMGNLVIYRLALYSIYADYPSRWLPSQNGLFFDFPHLQSVTLFQVSYCLPSTDFMGMPPRTQIEPCSPREEHSIIAIDFSNSGSIASSLTLS